MCVCVVSYELKIIKVMASLSCSGYDDDGCGIASIMAYHGGGGGRSVGSTVDPTFN